MTRECPEPERRAIRELPLPMLWLFGTLSLTGLIFSWLLRRREVGIHGHGLGTIPAKVMQRRREPAAAR